VRSQRRERQTVSEKGEGHEAIVTFDIREETNFNAIKASCSVLDVQLR